MTKLEKFQAIIEFLEKLDDSQFYYGDFVSDWDDNECGTVCCVSGWFPAIFPKYFKWDKSRFSEMSSIDNDIEATYLARRQFLEINNFADDALFFGNKNAQLELKLPITNLKSKLPEVIHLFKTFLENYKAGIYDVPS